MTAMQAEKCVTLQIQSKSDASKSYELTVQKHNNLAIDCSCGDRVFRGRKAGLACKHMMEYNNVNRGKPFVEQVEEATQPVETIEEAMSAEVEVLTAEVATPVATKEEQQEVVASTVSSTCQHLTVTTGHSNVTVTFAVVYTMLAIQWCSDTHQGRKARKAIQQLWLTSP